jgi:K+-transporting ATPase ATPase C chain
MLPQLRAATATLVLLTAITGVVYPLAMTRIAQVVYPNQANGSLILEDGRAIGSELIGQPFDAPEYFWGRLSATEPFPYNAAASSGSNLGPTNPALLEAAKARAKALHDIDRGNTQPLPVDLVTDSGSGLDPHITVAAALYQVPRVARARGVSQAQVRVLVEEYTEGRQWGLFGEPRVNVLCLNLALGGTE